MIKRKLSIFLFSIGAVSFSFSCAGPKANLSENISFVQDEIHMVLNNRLEIKSVLNYKNIQGKIDYQVSNDVVSIVDDYVVASRVGDCILTASSKKAKDDIHIFVESDKPSIAYDEVSFEFDINEGDFDLSEFVEITPSSASLDLTSDREDYSYVDGKITFTGLGEYVFNLSASYEEETSSPYTFEIYVYDTIKLDGEGSVANPYLIKTPEDLKRLSDAVLDYKDFKGKYFKQENDIDLSRYPNWTPIGTFGVPFEGIYDGYEHRVNNLNINTTESWQGLFGFSSGTIKNVIVDGNVKVGCNPDYVYSHSFCAGVCGGLYNAAIVSNCKNYASVHGDSYVGGIVGGIARSDEMIVGREQSKIINCENYGKITADDSHAYNEAAMYFGGICGESLGILTSNTNHGEVIVTGDNTKYVGGVCGLAYNIYKYGMYYDEDLEIYASNYNKNYGKVSGHHSVGGVYGANSLSAHGCENYGEVVGDICIGGVSGLNGTASVHDNESSIALLEGCINKGNVHANLRYAGGVTSCTYFDVINCQNEGKISGGEASYYIGGVVGYQNDGTIEDCINKVGGDVEGYYGLAGIAGWSFNNSNLIKDCQNYANIKYIEGCDLDAVHIGGIVGMLGSTNEVDSCDNYGLIKGQGNRNNPNRWGGTGGIAGSIYNASKIFSCVNHGRVEGNQQVGGIFGYSNGGQLTSVQSCTNDVDAIVASNNADPHLGGIAGRINNGSLIDNINKGKIEVVEGATNASNIYGSQGNAYINGNEDL